MKQDNGNHAAHTPGPWRVYHAPYNQLSVGTDVEDITGPDFEICRFGDTNDSEDEANARLIAAAPELLEALEGAVPFLEADQRICDFEVAPLTKARTAIAKAKGD